MRRKHSRNSRLLEALEDRRLMATFTVTSNANTGIGSLRNAITQANNNPGADIIAFNLPAGSRTIALTSALPSISGQVTIDGTTNPGYAGAPIVEITGNNTLIANALIMNASNSVVRGLSITGFARDANFNFGRGIVLNGSNNVVENNYFSLRPGGVSTLSLGRYGVELNGASNTIRNNAGYASQAFVANDEAASGAINNVIVGNLMGTSASGINLALTSGMNYSVILNAGSGNRIGGPNAVDRNVIAVPAFAGIYLNNNAGTTTIQNNFIGLNVSGSGSLAFSNPGTSGIQIVAGSGHLIRDNVIANANGNQIQLSTSTGIQIHGNRIGLTQAGAPAGTGQRAVFASGSEFGSLTIGSTNSVDRNWIMPGTLGGIVNQNSDGDMLVTNNVIGIAPNGSVSALHAAPGISVLATASKVYIEGNILGSAGSTDLIYAEALSNNMLVGSVVRIVGNQLGMNVAGTAAVGNSVSSKGIVITDTGNALVSQNKIAGVGVGISNVGMNYLYGNQIGLDASGINPLSVGSGIHSIFGVVGGSGPGEGNLIGDWTNSAIDVIDGTNALIRGNRIGTNIDNTGIYTGTTGIRSTVTSIIGGTNPGEGNTITGASMAIELGGGASTVQGNTLGLPGRPNGVGIRLAPAATNLANMLIGGDTASAGNTIAHNTGKAIVLTQTSGLTVQNVTIRRNSIHSNGGPAIDFNNDGLTANDPLDADTGVNGLQNFPLLFSADSSGGAQTAVTGFVNTSPSTPLVIDFYSADVANNEARTWLGSKTIVSDASGGASFSHSLPFVAGNKFIVATATNIAAFPNGATSEFSPAIAVTGPTDTTAPTASINFEFNSRQALNLVFSENVQPSLAMSDLTITNTTTNQAVSPASFSYDAGTNTATFLFNNNLPDGDYTASLGTNAVQDAAGNGNAATSSSFFVLRGDANRDRVVSFADLLIVAQSYGQSGKTFSQGNFDYDAAGNVGFSDLLILGQSYSSTLLTGSSADANRSIRRDRPAEIL